MSHNAGITKKERYSFGEWLGQREKKGMAGMGVSTN
jgi:hypothetical protein